MKNDFHTHILDTIQINFIILKACNLIDWSWVKVLIPFWIEVFLFLLGKLTLAILDDDNDII